MKKFLVNELLFGLLVEGGIVKVDLEGDEFKFKYIGLCEEVVY